MQLRADWEWGELVYHCWVKPIIELGNERVEGRCACVDDGHGLIWGTSVLVLLSFSWGYKPYMSRRHIRCPPLLVSHVHKGRSTSLNTSGDLSQGGCLGTLVFLSPLTTVDCPRLRSLPRRASARYPGLLGWSRISRFAVAFVVRIGRISLLKLRMVGGGELCFGDQSR
jgi:hypothetical protein